MESTKIAENKNQKKIERIPLKKGTVIINGQDRYVIGDLFGYGGSALIYTAEKCTAGNPEKKEVAIKEIYPSPENGCFGRREDGTLFPDYSDACENKRAADFLEKLYARLDQEESTGETLKGEAFLICPIKILSQAHFEESTTLIRGLSEMQNMNKSGSSLPQILKTLNQKYDENISSTNSESIGLRSLRIATKITETLLKIHAAGFLYGDLSPGNIFLLDGTGEAVFIDFGSTISLNSETAYIPCTPGYRAPELWDQTMSKKKTASADVFAVCSILFELISGESFAVPDDEFFRLTYDNSRLVPWSRMQEIGIANPTAGLILNYIFLHGLTKMPEQRIQTAGELLGLLNLAETMIRRKDLFSSLCILYKNELLKDLWISDQKEQIVENQLLWGFFTSESTIPDTQNLFLAVENLDKQLGTNSYDIQKMSFIFENLNKWYANIGNENKSVANSTEGRQTKLLLACCGLAICNHLGNYKKAVSFYQECESGKESIPLERYLDLRLKGAESYANIFNYRKASQIVSQNLRFYQKRKKFYSVTAKKTFGILSDFPLQTDEMGKTASAAGRYSAFLGQYKNAENYFQLSLQEFEQSARQKKRTENSYIQMLIAEGTQKEKASRYLCAYFGTDSLEKTLAELDNKLAHSRKTGNSGPTDYDLYLLLKAVRTYYMEDVCETFWIQLKQMVLRWIASENYVEGERFLSNKNHPWELIYRQAALLLCEKNQTVGEEEKQLFALSRHVAEKFDGFHKNQQIRKIPFNTMLILHMITLAEEYAVEIRLQSKKADKIHNLLSNIKSYLQFHGCRSIANELEKAGSWQQQYEILMQRFGYEYE